MSDIVSYFENISSLHRGAILAGGIAFFWLLESFKPLFTFDYNKWHHAWINIFFTLTTILVNFSMAFLLLLTAQWVSDNEFGIIQWLPNLYFLTYVVLGVALLDLIGAYLPHFLEHRIKFFWKFHLVHHTDTWVDTTTANRHHPGESVIRFVFTLIGVIIVGAPMWMVFLYQSLSVVFSQFNHANLNIPAKLDKWLSYIIISPDMHKIHHHYQLPYTDSNYGNILSIWDRLFGTFMYMKRENIVYGIDTHMDEKENNNLANLIKLPFQGYRPPPKN
jgi:sterol desaturase/sphingolipid hydroxylase (fatty acid hydroxylase superfamily)